MPSLDDVDGYLSQLAGLTNYSHDLQGVYDKKEVYQMLEWVFEKQFGLTNFNLLEVNASENRMEDVLERSDLSASHMEVFFNVSFAAACGSQKMSHPLLTHTSVHFLALNIQNRFDVVSPW